MPARKKQIDEKQVKEWIERGVKKLEDLDCGEKKSKTKVINSGSGWFWFLGFLGATTYFWRYVDSITTGFVAIVKGAVWPGFLVYHILKILRI